MKQWLRSMVLLSIPVIALGCKSDPTISDSAGVAAKLIATPKTVFIAQGTSEAVSVLLADVNDSPVPGTFTFTAPADANFSVVLDTTPRLIYNPDGVLVQNSTSSSARFVITATGFASSSFQVMSGNQSITIPISSYPATLPATLSTATPTLGQIIVVTAPAGTYFRATSTATIPGGQVNVVSRSADSSMLNVRIAPGSNGALTITNVGLLANPGLSFTVPTVAKASLAAVTTFSATPSTTTPAGGAPTTLTGGAGFKFAPNAVVSIGGVNAITAGISADSSVITIDPIPGSTGAVLVTGGVAGGFALGITPTSIASITTGAVVVKVAGTGALATAPQLTAKTGVLSGVVSAPPFLFASGCVATQGDLCDIYKVVTTTANQKVTATLNWNNNSDMGIFVLDATGTALAAGAGSADNGGTGTGGQGTETGTLTFVTPGTYYIAVLRFTYAGSTLDPTYYTLQLLGQ